MNPSEAERLWRAEQEPLTAKALSIALAVYKDRPYWGAPDAVRKAPAAFDIIRKAAHEHLACLNSDDVIAAARALSAQLHACIPAIDDAFKMQAVRGNWYKGPTFGKELAALDAALADAPVPSDGWRFDTPPMPTGKARPVIVAYRSPEKRWSLVVQKKEKTYVTWGLYTPEGWKLLSPKFRATVSDRVIAWQPFPEPPADNRP